MSEIHARTILFLGMILLAGCVQVDPVALDGLDDAGAGSRIDGAGSSWTRPRQGWRHDDVLAREISLPRVASYDRLPVDKLAEIRRDMTQAELIALLGPPIREDVEVQNVDSGGNDYNAAVLTWRYMDQRHASHPLLRELEVRLAWVDYHRPLPRRPEVMGPDWVVMSWDLY